MPDLRTYIAEAVSHGRNSRNQYIYIGLDTIFEDFIDIIEMSGYEGTNLDVPKKWNMEEMAPSVINEHGAKYYCVQHLPGGFHRVVLYNGVDGKTVFEIDFTEYRKGGICDLHRCEAHKDGDWYFIRADVEDLIKYIEAGYR